MDLLMKDKVSFRDGRYYIKKTNIRVDLVVGLGAKEILENYPWLSSEQIEDALDFVKECVDKQSSFINKKYGAPSEIQIQTG